MTDAKPQRKQVFSDGEIRTLIEQFEQNKDVLLTKFNSASTNAEKKKSLERYNGNSECTCH